MDNKSINVSSCTPDFPIPTPTPADTPTHDPPQIHPKQMALNSDASNKAQPILQKVDLSDTNMKEYGILDSGATSNFMVTNAPADDIQPVETGLNVKLPNNDRVTSSHTCNLKLNLPKEARRGHIVPGLHGLSLISVVTLCNAGCEVKFTKVECTVSHRGRVILRGFKCTRTGLWLLPLNQTVTRPPEMASHAHEEQLMAGMIETMSKPELARFLHQCFCSPHKVTFFRAIDNGQFRSVPGLTHELIAKHLPDSTATDKGHMHRTKQGIRSTRSNTQAIRDARAEVDDMFPSKQVLQAICSALQP